jgi:hypothetical protein
MLLNAPGSTVLETFCLSHSDPSVCGDLRWTRHKLYTCGMREPSMVCSCCLWAELVPQLNRGTLLYDPEWHACWMSSVRGQQKQQISRGKEATRRPYAKRERKWWMRREKQSSTVQQTLWFRLCTFHSPGESLLISARAQVITDIKKTL